MTDYNPEIVHTRPGGGRQRLETETRLQMPVAEVFPFLPLVRSQIERIFRFRAAAMARLVVPSSGDRREL